MLVCCLVSMSIEVGWVQGCCQVSSKINSWWGHQKNLESVYQSSYCKRWTISKAHDRVQHHWWCPYQNSTNCLAFELCLLQLYLYFFCVAYMDSTIFNVTTYFLYAGLNYQWLNSYIDAYTNGYRSNEFQEY